MQDLRQWANGCQAACFAALLLPATASSVIAQTGGSVAAATVDVSNVSGRQINITSRGSPEGFLTVAVNGTSKPIGSVSGATTSNETIIDVIASNEPPMLTPARADPKTGVPATSVLSPIEGPPAAGAASGAVLPIPGLLCNHSFRYLLVHLVYQQHFCRGGGGNKAGEQGGCQRLCNRRRAGLL